MYKDPGDRAIHGRFKIDTKNAYNQANNAYNFANTLPATIATAYGAANTASDRANTAYGAANAAYTLANGAYATANTANVTANNTATTAQAAFAVANGAANLSFVTVAANGTNLVADSNTDTLTLIATSNISISADAAGDNAKWDLVTTAVTPGTYGGFNNSASFLVDNSGRITNAANNTTILIRRHLVDVAAVNTAAQNQNWFPTLGNVTVQSGTLYRVEGVLDLVDTITTHTQSILFAGTATIDDFIIQIYHVDIVNNSTQISSTAASAIARLNWRLSTANPITTALVLNATSIVGNHVTHIFGYININTGGTLGPRFSISAVGAPLAGYTGPTIKRGTFFSLVPVSSNTVNAIGTWA